MAIEMMEHREMPDKVPIVIYDKNGVRRVVGEAKLELVDGDEGLVARVTDSIITDSSILKFFEPGTHGFSILDKKGQ